MSMTELLRGAMKRRDATKTLDSTGEEPALAGADNYTIADISMSAVSAVPDVPVVSVLPAAASVTPAPAVPDVPVVSAAPAATSSPSR